jgi:hypothetical protein
MRFIATVAAVVLSLGLLSTPAQAAGTTTRFQNQVGGVCLDFRADYGPYVTGCNTGDYQKWSWTTGAGFMTPLRQVATRLCLGLRYGQLKMLQCVAGDQEQGWYVRYTAGSSIPIIVNAYNDKCLAQGAERRVSVATCTGGNSQRWKIV